MAKLQLRKLETWPLPGADTEATAGSPAQELGLGDARTRKMTNRPCYPHIGRL